MTQLDPELLAREGHGAVEVDLPTTEPLIVMLAGPIKIWWAEGMWDTDEHREYTQWRDAVRVACVKAGHLVYSPHRAWQGAWSEAAQRVNDMAIQAADALIDIRPIGITADGTEAEIAHAELVGTPVISSPPGTGENLAELLESIQALRR